MNQSIISRFQFCSVFIKKLLNKYYYLSVMQFFISFLSIQLYVFFFHVLIKLKSWKRVLAGLWTVSVNDPYVYIYIYFLFIFFIFISIGLQFEMNTISIMKPAKKGHYIYLIISWVLTVLMMIVSVTYGEIAIKHQRGLFVSL